MTERTRTQTLLEVDLRTGLWAIDPRALSEMLSRAKATNVRELRSSSETVGSWPSRGGLAVIPVYGPISHRPSMWSAFFGGTSTMRISEQLRIALEDPSVSRIVLDIDSPGGTVDGVPELAGEILAARAKKPITAIANSLATSAAYWLAAQATELIVAPSGEVGSIGVFALHTDYSKALENEGIKVTFIKAGKYKTEGNPYEPLGDEARAAFQSRIDDWMAMFVKSVALGRGVTSDKVRQTYGQGRCVAAAEAVRLGMADRSLAFTPALAGLAGRRASASAADEDLERRERVLRRLRLAS